MAIQRMDNVAIVVDDLEAAIAFFVELGMELEGQQAVEGRWAERVVGLDDMQSEIAMMRTPDGQSRLELTKYHRPTATQCRTEDRSAEHVGPTSSHVRRRRHQGHRRPLADPRR